MEIQGVRASLDEQRERFRRLDAEAYVSLTELIVLGDHAPEGFKRMQALCTDALNAYDDYLRTRRRLLSALMSRHRKTLTDPRHRAA
jgi:hypothetical protein